MASTVQHPRLGTVLSAHLRDAPPYLVLPYLEGATLQQILGALACSPHGALSPCFALAVARQVAVALTELHGAGWLHSQVRPDHIIVSPQGHATLIDFSLARRLDSDECDARTFAFQDFTYAAPESLGSGWCSAASDVYSLGIVLYEMLTGRPPFRSTNPQEVARLQRTCVAPAIRSILPQAPLELNELVRRMLAKEPLRRPSGEQLIRWIAEIEILELQR